MTEPPQMSNADLQLMDIPAPDGQFDLIQAFAYTFDGYQAASSFEQCAAIANERRHATLTELRACLLFEQRRSRHTGSDPDLAQEAYQRDLIVQIRAKVAQGDKG